MDHAIRTGDKEGVFKFLHDHQPNAVSDYYKNLAKLYSPQLLPLLDFYEKHRETFSMAEIARISNTAEPLKFIDREQRKVL